MELNESMSLEELYLHMQERRKEKIALFKSKDYALEKAKKEYGDSLIGYVEYERGFKFYTGDITSDRCGTAYWADYDDEKGIVFRIGGCCATYNIPKNIVKIER